VKQGFTSNQDNIMSEIVNLNPDPQNPHGQPPPQAEGPHCVLDSLCAAVRDGASQAKHAAEKAAPKVKAAMSDALYWLGFGVSYGSVFSAVLVKELAPEALKTGGRDGAEAGAKAASDFMARWQHRPPAPVAAGPMPQAT
jgi:hypothetical protein